MFFSVKMPKLHPLTWAEDLLEPEIVPRKEAEVLIIVLWAVWHSRNKYTHGEEKFQPYKSMQLIDDIVRSLEILPVMNKSMESVEKKWEKQSVGWVKINTDGVVDVGAVRGGTGIVARDHLGEFLFARCTSYGGITDPETLEVLACRDAMLAAREKGVANLIIESDCANIKSLWESKLGERTASFHVLLEMRILASCFQGVKLLYVSRSSNKAAHCAAKEALCLNHVTDYDFTPGFLIALVQSEKLQPVE